MTIAPINGVSIRYAKPEDQPGWVRWVSRGVIRMVIRIYNTPFFLKWRRYSEYMWKGALHTPLYTLRTLSVSPSFKPVMLDVHVTGHPEIVKALLQLHRNGPTFSTQGGRKQAFVYLMEAVFPNILANNNDSILSCDEEHSYRFRSLLHKAFTAQKIKEQESVVQSIINTTLDRWSTLGIFQLQDLMKIFTAELVGKLFLGFDGPYDKIAHAISSQLFPFMGRAAWAQGQTKMTPEEEKGKQVALETVKSIFDKAHDPLSPPSLIKTMMKEGFSDQEIRAMILTLLIAGQDTTSSLLCYILMEMAVDPTLQHFYLNGTINSKMLIAEGLRMMPPASFIARVPGQDLVIQLGEDITFVHANQLIAASPVYLGKNRSIVPGTNLELFLPHRWINQPLPENLTQLPWFPMGGGAHECVGHKVANFNMTLFLDTILNKYELRTPLKKMPPRINVITSRLEGNLPFSLHLREKNTN